METLFLQSHVFDGARGDQAAPVLVSGGSLAGRKVVAIAAGSSHSVGLDSAGNIHAWGCNGAGQLGDGTTTNNTVPKVAIAAGGYHTVALHAAGRMRTPNGQGTLRDRVVHSARNILTAARRLRIGVVV
jgi:hypothetical protein